MTRSDILLNTTKINYLINNSNIEDKNYCLNHIANMEHILDKFWLLMLQLNNNKNFKKLGELMKGYFDE